MKIQGQALISMIQLNLSVFKDRSKSRETLLSVANAHSNRGVRASQYGVFYEVLLWTLGHCLGDAFTAEMHHAWAKLLSDCLSILLPAAVANDRKHESIRSETESVVPIEESPVQASSLFSSPRVSSRSSHVPSQLFTNHLSSASSKRIALSSLHSWVPLKSPSNNRQFHGPTVTPSTSESSPLIPTAPLPCPSQSPRRPRTLEKYMMTAVFNRS